MMTISFRLVIPVNTSWGTQKVSSVGITEDRNKKSRRVFIGIQATYLVLKMVEVHLISALKNVPMYQIWLHRSNINRRIIRPLSRLNKISLHKGSMNKTHSTAVVRGKSLILIWLLSNKTSLAMVQDHPWEFHCLKIKYQRFQD